MTPIAWESVMVDFGPLKPTKPPALFCPPLQPNPLQTMLSPTVTLTLAKDCVILAADAVEIPGPTLAVLLVKTPFWPTKPPAMTPARDMPFGIPLTDPVTETFLMAPP